MFKAHFLFGLLLLTACTSPPAEHATATLVMLRQQANLCFLNLKDDPELAAIGYFVALESLYEDDAHYELLNNSDFPTLWEKVIIDKWAIKLEQCYKLKRETYLYESRGVVRCLSNLESDQKSLVRNLVGGKLTYGQFATNYYFAYSNHTRFGHNGCDE